MLVAFFAGCQHAPPPPPPLVAPPVALRTAHFAGSPLSGPVARALAIGDPTGALAVQVQFIAIEGPAPALLEPLLTRARLITSSRGGMPIVPSGQATLAARFGPVEDGEALLAELDKHGRHVELGKARGALCPGGTVAFDLADASPRALPPPRRIEIDVSRPAIAARTPAPAAPQIQFAVIVDDLPPASLTTQPSTRPGTLEPAIHRELVILDTGSLDRQSSMALILAFKLGDGATATVLAFIAITPGSLETEHQEACKRADADLKAAFARATAKPDALLTNNDAPSIQNALAAIARGQRVRSSLAFLAGQTGARLCDDVCLVADEETLTLLAGAILRDAPPDSAPPPSTLAWTIDRAVLGFLSGLWADSKLPPELASILTAHAGEVARHAGSLEDVLKASRDRDDLNRRLIAENLIFLEDGSPSARVRAYDWLWARSRAPAGFDPLAPARERRLALQKAATAPAVP